MPKQDFEISGFSTEIYANLFQEFDNSLFLLRRDPKISKFFKYLKNLESTASGTWISSQNQVNIQAKYAILNLVLTWS